MSPNGSPIYSHNTVLSYFFLDGYEGHERNGMMIEHGDDYGPSHDQEEHHSMADHELLDDLRSMYRGFH